MSFHKELVKNQNLETFLHYHPRKKFDKKLTQYKISKLTACEVIEWRKINLPNLNC